MPPLPTGTVTLLFTDIEGSTQMLQHLGDAGYALVLADHRRLLRAAFEAGGGHEIETQGDAFLIVFQGARDAVSAAVAAQRTVHAHRWPDGATLRVRMGLHTSEVVTGSVGYTGLGIHKAARICAAGWGGQILISRTTADVLENDLPAGLIIQDLGEHLLKDLQRPERILQIVHPELPGDFPPPRTLDSLPNNLPQQLTSFIGREREMADVRRLLFTTRLLTLTGSGGCGKTRLALQVAAELAESFKDGVWLVELAPLSDPALVPQTVASALHVREQPGRPLLATLSDYLAHKDLMLVLDNCEHLVAACAPMVEALLRACPSLRIMATSREPLGVAGETTWRVPSLPLPDLLRLPPLENLTQYEAVRLFIERAVAAKPDFSVTNRNAPSVVRTCHRLDGIPLAIELAAARVKVLPVHQIAARLDNRFRLLTGGSRTTLPRQQTLRATMDWSYDLLPENERTLLRRLAVFAGGWTLEAAEAVCGEGGIDPTEVLDLLTRLVDKSLVMALVTEDATGEARYWQLETVRQYAMERLREADEETVLRRRHRDFFLGLAVRVESELRGASQMVWLKHLKGEIDNLRAALEWNRLDLTDPDTSLRLAAALWWFWFNQGTLSEGRMWLEGALAASPPTESIPRAGALYGAGAIAWLQGDMRRAAELAQEALGMCRDLGDRLGVVYSLCILGVIAMIRGEYDRATGMFEEGLALSRALGREWETATALSLLGWSGRYWGDFQRAAALSAESLALFRNAGDQWGMASALCHLGSVTGRLGDLAKAKILLAESVQLARGLGNRPQLAVSLHELGRVMLALGADGEATELEREALALRRDQGEMWGIAECLEGLAAVARSQGRFERAARLIGAAEIVRETVRVPLPAADRADYEQGLMALRAALGDQAFLAVREEGWTAPLDTVVEDAMTGSRASDR